MKIPEVTLDVDVNLLTNREREVLVALAQGYPNREIAVHLQVNVKTIDTHRGHVIKKLRLRNNSDITRYAIKNGLIDVNGNESPSSPPVERFDPQTDQTM